MKRAEERKIRISSPSPPSQSLPSVVGWTGNAEPCLRSWASRRAPRSADHGRGQSNCRDKCVPKCNPPRRAGFGNEEKTENSNIEFPSGPAAACPDLSPCSFTCTYTLTFTYTPFVEGEENEEVPFRQAQGPELVEGLATGRVRPNGGTRGAGIQ